MVYRRVMATLRDLRKRVKAVKNTQKITRAMKMVAASKLRRAQNAILDARPYAEGMERVLHNVVRRTDTQAHPLLQVRVPKKVELVVVTSDRGLCGSFNSNIIRSAERWLAENESKYESVEISTIGKKGRDHFRRRGRSLKAEYEDVLNKLDYDRASAISYDLAARFRQREDDVTFLLYNEFKSAISQNVTLKQLLPIRSIEGWEDAPNVRIGELAVISGNRAAVAGRTTDVLQTPEDVGFDTSQALEFQDEGFDLIYEPSRESVLDNLLPEYLAVQVWRALLESVAAEHGARMTAMDAASRNASDLIDRLTLEANRVRQAGITTELMEIVSGAESLRAG